MYGSNHLQRITKVRILFYLIPMFFDLMSPNMSTCSICAVPHLHDIFKLNAIICWSQCRHKFTFQGEISANLGHLFPHWAVKPFIHLACGSNGTVFATWPESNSWLVESVNMSPRSSPWHILKITHQLPPAPWHSCRSIPKRSGPHDFEGIDEAPESYPGTLGRGFFGKNNG